MRKPVGYRGYKGNSPQKKKRPWLAALLILVGLGLVLLGALEIVIAMGSRDRTFENGPQPTAMVIFGCQVKPDGPSILLRDRLDTALAYWEEHPDIKIVVTGGKGDDEHISEAQCMYDYLTAHGVDGANIYMEDQSRNTWQNIEFSRPLMENNGMDCMVDCRPILVSSGFHLSRILMLWERTNPEGWPPATLAAPVSHAPSAVLMFFREPLALVKSFVFDR